MVSSQDGLSYGFSGRFRSGDTVGGQGGNQQASDYASKSDVEGAVKHPHHLETCGFPHVPMGQGRDLKVRLDPSVLPAMKAKKRKGSRLVDIKTTAKIPIINLPPGERHSMLDI